MNEYAQAVVAEAEKMLGRPYVVGVFNCDLLVRKAFGNVPDPNGSKDGLRDLIGGALPNVRAFDAWAHANGRFRDKTVTPEPGWVFLWGPAAGGKPVHGAGHMGVVEEGPSPENPHGKAISAYNPARGTIEHRLYPKPNNHLALWGYIEPAWPIDPPIVDPEPPAPDDAVDPPDYAAMYAALRAKANQASALLTED
ncbi:MAG: hypothetical protein QOJ81_2189 [Chloroflexota bacterium]|nr:hypothetical protein [Chloroflexota bacterium]